MIAKAFLFLSVSTLALASPVRPAPPCTDPNAIPAITSILTTDATTVSTTVSATVSATVAATDATTVPTTDATEVPATSVTTVPTTSVIAVPATSSVAVPTTGATTASTTASPLDGTTDTATAPAATSTVIPPASSSTASISTSTSTASGTSTPGATSGTLPLLSSTLQVQGGSVSQLLDTHGDGNIDVRVLAQQMANNWSTPADTTGTIQLWDWTGTMGRSLHLNYSVGVTTCSRPQTKIISSDPFLYCNGGASCSFAKTLSTTQTNTHQYGYSVGISVAGGFGAPPLVSTVTLTSSFNEAWTSSETTTNSETYTFNMQPGEVCGPMSIQFSSKCTSTFTLNAFRIGYHYGDNDLDADVCDAWFNSRAGLITLLGLNDPTLPSNAFDMIQSVCNSAAPSNNQGVIEMDITPGSGLQPYVVMGCAYTA